MAIEKQIVTEQEMQRTIERLACEVLERMGDGNDLVLVGIQRRGVELADRLRGIMVAKTGTPFTMGKLDINLYRDDWTSRSGVPSINSTHLPVSIKDRNILLVDDVLFTGRTIRAALEAILDFGRPRSVRLLVLVDRGNRELPIQADFVGKKIQTGLDEQVDVRVREVDGQDKVVLLAPGS
ncbi:bifunctional pyr operon transcriptional regulator/uracil phosphoribosyltransferase PyrR [Desulfoplanes formicivorans]|uniref:Bifunctional protein PyrR n=1 Tax=Desulfoplanes formicivorans TaxID=1592317 RepID=A0A194AJU8_9BACT|nr:bifunctional pyr operon transcriptional regulator/uracil phosphoribosyltransferase PyrR [Desulfoplanes formicivorans]GAU09331.1 bifunctional pyr operon transcriptional regulator/uracil phosphoribosyltransferase [Desulfoplanes formicivorans]